MKYAIKCWVGAIVCSVLVSCACKEDVVNVPLLETAPGTQISLVTDQDLARAFNQKPFSGDDYVVHWYPHSIEITTFVGLDVPGVVDTVAEYKAKAGEDAIARAFIQIAQQRGQSVKLYNAKANTAIVGCVRQRPTPSSTLRTDLDPSLVAYDHLGNLTAALVRIHRFDKHAVTDHHFVVSKIYFGSLARDIELQLGGPNKLRSELIRSI